MACVSCNSIIWNEKLDCLNLNRNWCILSVHFNACNENSINIIALHHFDQSDRDRNIDEELLKSLWLLPFNWTHSHQPIAHISTRHSVVDLSMDKRKLSLEHCTRHTKVWIKFNFYFSYKFMHAKRKRVGKKK